MQVSGKLHAPAGLPHGQSRKYKLIGQILGLIAGKYLAPLRSRSILATVMKPVAVSPQHGDGSPTANRYTVVTITVILKEPNEKLRPQILQL